MVRIRPFKREDMDSLLRWLEDERTVALWRADRFVWPVTPEQLERYYRDFEEDGSKAAFTALDEAGRAFGHFSIRDMDWGENRGHMGFIITDPELRGRGLGRQMVHQALRYGFEILGLSRITLGVYDCNGAARRCYEAEGFARCERPGFITEFYGEEWEYFYMEAAAGKS